MEQTNQEKIIAWAVLILTTYFTFSPSPVVKICTCKANLKRNDIDWLQMKEGHAGYGRFDMGNCQKCGTTITVKLKKANPDYFVPPKNVSSEAKKGLELRKEFGRGGTAVGIKRAHQLKNKERISLTTVKRMNNFFNRHQKNKNNDPKKSNGKIAWLLWGGDNGRKWAKSILRKSEKEE